MGKADFLQKAGLTPSEHLENAAVPKPEEQVEPTIATFQPDPCPMCTADVGWSELPLRRSPVAIMLKHGYYRRCPECDKVFDVGPPRGAPA